jgi:hypothetical protein
MASTKMVISGSIVQLCNEKIGGVTTAVANRDGYGVLFSNGDKVTLSKVSTAKNNLASLYSMAAFLGCRTLRNRRTYDSYGRRCCHNKLQRSVFGIISGINPNPNPKSRIGS